MSTGTWLMMIALAIVSALVIYALYLALQLRSREKQREAARMEVEKIVHERQSDINNSIAVIAHATLSEQVSVSESCIRLSSLLNQLGPVAAQDRFQVIHKVAQELSHIPILDAWKKLKFQQRMVYLQDMARIEQKYRDFVLESCRDIQIKGIEATNGDVAHYRP